LSGPEAGDLARVLAGKAGDDSKAMRLLAGNADISDEIVGFHAQQAIEKWLKAVMLSHGLEEARIHDLGRLLEILGKADIPLPPGADWLDALSIYAVPLRYSDLLDIEPLDRQATIALVEEIGGWAADQLARPG
jgi:HEPN domain-containing protein